MHHFSLQIPDQKQIIYKIIRSKFRKFYSPNEYQMAVPLCNVIVISEIYKPVLLLEAKSFFISVHQCEPSPPLAGPHIGQLFVEESGSLTDGASRTYTVSSGLIGQYVVIQNNNVAAYLTLCEVEIEGKGNMIIYH